MTPDKPGLHPESESDLNIFRDARFFMVLAVITVLSAGCASQKDNAVESDNDLAGVADDDAGPEPEKKWMRPVPEKDADPIICEEIPVIDGGMQEEEKSFEELVAEVDRILKFGVPYQLTEKISRVGKGRICYAGDSYMKGITAGRKGKVVEENVKAEIGRPFVSNEDEWAGDDIETHATAAINNPDCRLLIMNGGFNDLLEDCNDETFERLLAGYKRVLDKINERVGRGKGGFEVIYYDIPITPRKGKEMQQVNAYAEDLNNFMAEQEGTVRVINTSGHIRKWRKDGMHPKPGDYRRLFDQVRKFIR